MAKFYGAVGYAKTIETSLGVWEDIIVEHNYYGDLVRNTRKLQNSGYVNDNINISNDISIIADPYAYENFHNIKYVVFMGTKWKVSNIEVQYPRLILSIGDVYNE